MSAICKHSVPLSRRCIDCGNERLDAETRPAADLEMWTAEQVDVWRVLVSERPTPYYVFREPGPTGTDEGGWYALRAIGFRVGPILARLATLGAAVKEAMAHADAGRSMAAPAAASPAVPVAGGGAK